MPASCPHCQHPAASALAAGTQPDDTCPACGKRLSENAASTDQDTAGVPSLASYLQSATTTAPATAPPATQAEIAGPATTAAASMTEAVADGPDDAAESPLPASTDMHDAGIEPETQQTEPQPGGADATPAAAPIATAAARRTAGPRFAHAPRTAPVQIRVARWQWAAAAVLAALLCVQVVMADRDRLAAQAGWRPVVSLLCGALRCDVPTWREPAAFAMLSRDVRPLPGVPGVLQAQATFRNDARWAQAWPVILLTLKDADGRTLGARALQPRDYLPEGEASAAIAPGQSAQVAVRVREPSANVVAFSFDFR